jgi:hypothetical protein
MNGDDLNSDPEQRPSRWVINFWDWPEERARKYKKPWAWIEERVKPERQRRDEKGNFVLRRPLPDRWWQYGDKRPALYHAIGRGHSFEQHPEGWRPDRKPLKEVLVTAFVGKYFGPSVVANNAVFSHACAVFSVSPPCAFAALLNSSIGQAWVWQQSSRMKTDLRLAPSDAIETFPFPERVETLDVVGKSYLAARREIMRAEGLGLTKLYNRFHNPKDADPRIKRLRQQLREIDVAVACAYRWNDLDMSHGFHEVPFLAENDRVRYTISEPARLEVLRLLGELNRERFQAEEASASSAKPRVTKGRRNSASTGQGALDLSTMLASSTHESTPIASPAKKGRTQRTRR